MKRIGIVGGGHNGLIAACYLAKAGHAVTVLERRHIFGGLAVSEELFPGCRVSSVANRSGMLRKNIIADLRLERHGLRLFRPKYASHIISTGDAFTFIHGTQGEPHSFQVAGLRDSDLTEWNTFWGELESAGAILAVGIRTPGYTSERFLSQLRDRGFGDLCNALFKQSLFEYAKTRVRNSALLSAILTMSGSIPFTTSSLFEVIYYCTAESFDEPAAWGYVVGGMGSISEAVLAEAQELGVVAKAGTEVRTVVRSQREGTVAVTYQEQGRAGVGEHVLVFDSVILATDPVTAYRDLLAPHRHELPPALFEEMNKNDSVSTYGVLHLRLSELPEVPVLKTIGRSTDTFSGAFDFSLTAEELESWYHRSSESDEMILPNLSCNVFSAVDETVCKGRGHVMTVLIQGCSNLYRGKPWDDAARNALYTECLTHLSPWIPNLSKIVTDYRVITPTDLERTYGVKSGSCFHLRYSKAHALENRPFPSVAGCRTPIEGVYLAGAGAYPAGCVSGLPGMLCSEQVINDFKEQGGR